MKTKKPVSKRVAVADKLFSELIHKRKVCERCGKDKNLQTAHVIPRTNKHLRWNEDNALLLCVACHLYWQHKNPLEFSDWFQLEFPVRNGFLMREKNKVNNSVSSTIEFTIQTLKDKLKQNETL